MNKKFKILFTPESIQHIKEIVLKYNGKSKGLGDRFKSKLKASFAEISSNPFASTVRYEEVRFAVPKKFPYAAHYTIDESLKAVIIHAVLGFAEKPEKWVNE